MRSKRGAAMSLLLLSFAATCSASDSGSLRVPSGTKVRLEITHRSRLKTGEAVQGRSLEPIYVDNRLAVPQGALLSGRIAAVRPAPRSKRLDAKFHGDFTPLGEPVIRFTGLTLADGEHYSMAAEAGGGSGTTLYFRTAGEPQKSVFRRMWDSVSVKKNSAISTVKAPGKADRLKQLFWSQMPYHPQSVEAGTQYEASFTEQLELPASAPTAASGSVLHPSALSAGAPGTPEPIKGLISVQGRLRTQLDSAKARPGDPVEAVVTQPAFDDNHNLLIPQGTVLRGKVLQAAPAGRWGHNGLLRFSFNEINLPAGFRQNVEGVPTAIAGSRDQDLRVDQEGGITLPSKRSVMAPLVLGVLATSGMADEDADLLHSATSSNGFGIIARVIAIASRSQYVGGSIGMVATGRSVYTRWLAHGKNLQFGEDTEIQLQLSPERARQLPVAR